jgi:hypothetical protein
MPTDRDLRQIGIGSRATAVIRDRHGARLPFQSVDEPSAEYASG